MHLEESYVYAVRDAVPLNDQLETYTLSAKNESEVNVDDFENDLKFATSLLLIVYVAMFIAVVLLFLRIIYVCLARKFHQRPNTVYPPWSVNSIDTS
ncbi:hypothetical protein B4U80_05473 [Leptotrombidium deliense]|uniref:Uncharacterized protein n=1 Tax=Leptotrombidium deliense TaxID=299467 RepID=A0A443SGN8_9ACAR|nr:hypothetical protein B4U80_05473 [Leptotrombidium deliense]